MDAAMLTLIRRGRSRDEGRASVHLRLLFALAVWVIGRKAGRVKSRLRPAGGGGAVGGGAELTERAILDLAHPLAGEADPLADLSKRLLVAVEPVVARRIVRSRSLRLPSSARTCSISE